MHISLIPGRNTSTVDRQEVYGLLVTLSFLFQGAESKNRFRQLFDQTFGINIWIHHYTQLIKWFKTEWMHFFGQSLQTLGINIIHCQCIQSSSTSTNAFYNKNRFSMWDQCRNRILWISSHILDQYFIQLCCWFHGLVWFSRLMCQNRNMCGGDANNVFIVLCVLWCV